MSRISGFEYVLKMTKHKILTYYCPKNAEKCRENPQRINVQKRNFNRHIMTAKTQNTYIILT